MEELLDLKAGHGPPPAKRGDLVFNVSRIADYLRCPARYAYRYIDNRVKEGPEPRYLLVGRAVHAAAEQVNMGKPFDLVEAFIDAEFDDILTRLSDDSQKELADKERQWAKAAIEVYYEHVLDRRFGWQTIVAHEEPLWLRLFRGNVDVYVMGTPDVVVAGTNQKLRHVQLKTLSHNVDPSHFATQTRFALHEAVYGEMIARTYGQSMDLPYQGTELLMLPKVMKPQPPKNRTKDGRITDHYAKMLDKYRVNLTAWKERVLERRVLAMDQRWRTDLLVELCDSVFGMTALKEGVRPRVRAGGGACNRYGGPCGYLPVCAGEARLDGSSYAPRTKDYVDEVSQLPDPDRASDRS